jgi:quercetin dioxygenase-like cupin family protein
MQRAEHQPVGHLCVYAGIYAKRWTIQDRGTLLPQHSHEWPHISYIVSGVVRVWRGDEQLGDFVGPCAVKIPAQTLHKFLTLSDNVVILCLHNADRLDSDEPAVREEHQLVTED